MQGFVKEEEAESEHEIPNCLKLTKLTSIDEVMLRIRGREETCLKSRKMGSNFNLPEYHRQL